MQADGGSYEATSSGAKPNLMPESVTDRPTKAHEYVFLGEAAAVMATRTRFASRQSQTFERTLVRATGSAAARATRRGGRCTLQARTRLGGMRGRYDIATQPTPEAHFATFRRPGAPLYPGGSSERARQRVWRALAAAGRARRRPALCATGGARQRATQPGNATVKTGTFGSGRPTTQAGWAASCQCGAPPRPQLVLDPFVGSGTTALVARKHGRRATGIDLSSEYLAIAARRTAQLSLLGEGVG